MFKDKTFNISFIFSLCWHLFWISAVVIISAPAGFMLADYPKISFLGPILGKTAFELMLEESAAKIGATYQRPEIPKYVFDIEIDSPKNTIFSRALEFQRPSMLDISLRDVIGESKMIVPHFLKEIYPVSTEKTGIHEPLKKRKLIYKPEQVPKVPFWIIQDRKSFKIELEFTVSPDGFVEKIKPIVSSGYPKLDMLGMDYVKKWRFTPLDSAAGREPQTGRVEIELKAD